MPLPSSFNILMYSHDTYGLGHIRRTMSIANHLKDSNTNILILTGSPIAGRFLFPDQVDFVRIPGMIKKTNDEYQSLSIRIEAQQALNIRTSIIKATAKTFQPDLFIIDKEPLGLKREVLPTLKWLKSRHPQTRTILGLRDILDESEVIRKDWKKKGIYHHLETLYDEIWVYGEQEIYDPIEQYRIPAASQNKVVFTGYIPRKTINQEIRKKIRKRYKIINDDIFILVTTGGGGDGGNVLDCFVAMHEQSPSPLPFKSVIVTGPFMPKPRREELKGKARRFGITTIPFHPHMEELMMAADLVLSMGGYNTICEILTQRTAALIVPRESPRLEQNIRARCLHAKGLIEYIPWSSLNPLNLRDKIFSTLGNRQRLQENMASFPLSGLETMRRRLEIVKQEKHVSLHAEQSPQP